MVNAKIVDDNSSVIWTNLIQNNCFIENQQWKTGVLFEKKLQVFKFVLYQAEVSDYLAYIHPSLNYVNIMRIHFLKYLDNPRNTFFHEEAQVCEERDKSCPFWSLVRFLEKIVQSFES
jgi:hypothetical protein